MANIVTVNCPCHQIFWARGLKREVAAHENGSFITRWKWLAQIWYKWNTNYTPFCCYMATLLLFTPVPTLTLLQPIVADFFAKMNRRTAKSRRIITQHLIWTPGFIVPSVRKSKVLLSRRMACNNWRWKRSVRSGWNYFWDYNNVDTMWKLLKLGSFFFGRRNLEAVL